MTIRKLAHGESSLWHYLGPFLSSRAVHTELGGPIYSTPETTWWIACEGPVTIGFVSLRQAPSATHYDYDYIVAAHRGQGVYTRLAAARDVLGRELVKPLRTVICAPRWKGHREHGWKKISVRGQWITAGKDTP